MDSVWRQPTGDVIVKGLTSLADGEALLRQVNPGFPMAVRSHAELARSVLTARVHVTHVSLALVRRTSRVGYCESYKLHVAEYTVFRNITGSISSIM